MKTRQRSRGDPKTTSPRCDPITASTCEPEVHSVPVCLQVTDGQAPTGTQLQGQPPLLIRLLFCATLGSWAWLPAGVGVSGKVGKCAHLCLTRCKLTCPLCCHPVLCVERAIKPPQRLSMQAGLWVPSWPTQSWALHCLLTTSPTGRSCPPPPPCWPRPARRRRLLLSPPEQSLATGESARAAATSCLWPRCLHAGEPRVGSGWTQEV